MKQVLAISMIAVLLALLALPALAEIQAIAHPTGEMIIGYQVVLKIRSAAGGTPSRSAAHGDMLVILSL